jgi:UDP-glucose 4-epimerase
MRVLVTGSSGYIGREVCRVLSGLGDEVIPYDRVIGMELDDRETREAALSRVDRVIHLAAYTDVAESVLEPLKYFRNNVGNTLNLLEWGPITFVSSCAAVDPVNPYGESKALAETVLKYTGSSILRLFNVYGLGGRGLVAKVLEAAGSGRPVDVYGTDYETPDGTCIRDYVHVSDVAQAIVKGDSGDVGSGVGTSVFEVIRIVEKATGTKIRTNLLPRRPGDKPIAVSKGHYRALSADRL